MIKFDEQKWMEQLQMSENVEVLKQWLIVEMKMYSDNWKHPQYSKLEIDVPFLK